MNKPKVCLYRSWEVQTELMNAVQVGDLVYTGRHPARLGVVERIELRRGGSPPEAMWYDHIYVRWGSNPRAYKNKRYRLRPYLADLRTMIEHVRTMQHAYLEHIMGEAIPDRTIGAAMADGRVPLPAEVAALMSMT